MGGIVPVKFQHWHSYSWIHTIEHVRDSVHSSRRTFYPLAIHSILDADMVRVRTNRVEVMKDSYLPSSCNFWIVYSKLSISFPTTLNSIPGTCCCYRNTFTLVVSGHCFVIRRENVRLWQVSDRGHIACGNTLIPFQS